MFKGYSTIMSPKSMILYENMQSCNGICFVFLSYLDVQFEAACTCFTFQHNKRDQLSLVTNNVLKSNTIVLKITFPFYE